MWRIFISCLFVPVWATTEVVVEDIELSNLIDDGEPISLAAAVGRATSWLLDERRQESSGGGWGPFTPRAVAALAIAESAGALSLPSGEWSLLAKQLNVLLSIEVGNGADKNHPLGVSRLSHYINALYATCQDPRHFHGLDLVQKLRRDTDADVRLAGDQFPFPIALVTLCLAGEATRLDLTRLAKMHQNSFSKPDLQALQLLAMSCITSQQAFASARPIFDTYLRDFASKFRSSLQHNTTDVYTKAMAMQALNSGEIVDNVSVPSLLSDQESDGSFERSPLATYHAIPALLGTSLLAVRNVRCPSPKQEGVRGESFPQADSTKRTVHLSLWIGEGAERDTHSVTVAIGANDTLLDVMRTAQERNDIFRFGSDATPAGARVYSLAGLPNDSEREVYWQLYVQRNGHNQHLHEITKEGVDKVYPSADDHIVFWFKRNSIK